MRSAELTVKVTAFSRTLRLRGKKEEREKKGRRKREKRQEEETEEGGTLMKEEEMSGREEGGSGGVMAKVGKQHLREGVKLRSSASAGWVLTPPDRVCGGFSRSSRS